MNSDYTFLVASPPDYEDLTVEIYLKEIFIALLSRGDKAQYYIEFDPVISKNPVNLIDFLAAVSIAQTKLDRAVI